MTAFKFLGSAAVAGVLFALVGSANAATVHHYQARHHHVAARFARSYAYAPAPVGTSVSRYNDTPSYNDASKFGGSTALSAE